MRTETLLWVRQRDKTQKLMEFETLAFSSSRCICLDSLNQNITLDEDLYGEREADNQVNSLRARKADREGHSAEVKEDTLFRATIEIRVRRSGESQPQSILNIFDGLLERRGEQSLYGLVVTADRGFAKPGTVIYVRNRGLGCLFIISRHIISYYPYMEESRLNVCIECELESMRSRLKICRMRKVV